MVVALAVKALPSILLLTRINVLCTILKNSTTLVSMRCPWMWPTSSKKKRKEVFFVKSISRKKIQVDPTTPLLYMSIQIAQPYLLLLQQIYPNLCCCKPEMTLKIFVFTKKRRIIELKNNVFCLLEMSVKWNPNSCLKFCGLWLNNFPRFIKNFLVDTQYYKWHYTYSTLCAKRALFNLKSVWNRQLHSAWLKNTHCDLTTQCCALPQCFSASAPLVSALFF